MSERVTNSREAYAIDQKAGGSTYVDEEDGQWCVFGSDSGFCYGTYADKGEAIQKMKSLNNGLKENQLIKKSQKIEEALRPIVRKLLQEMNIGTSVEETVDEVEEGKHKTDSVGGDMGYQIFAGDSKGDKKTASKLAHKHEGAVTESDEDGDVEPSTKRRGWGTKIGSDVDTAGGADFKTIAAELGFSVSGAKSAVDKAIRKSQFMSKMQQNDPEAFDELILTAVDDWLDYLESSGELTVDDKTFLKTDPRMIDAVVEGEEFREFLHKYIRRAGYDSSGLKGESTVAEAKKNSWPRKEIDFKTESGKTIKIKLVPGPARKWTPVDTTAAKDAKLTVKDRASLEKKLEDYNASVDPK